MEAQTFTAQGVVAVEVPVARLAGVTDAALHALFAFAQLTLDDLPTAPQGVAWHLLGPVRVAVALCSKTPAIRFPVFWKTPAIHFPVFHKTPAIHFPVFLKTPTIHFPVFRETPAIHFPFFASTD